MSSIAIGPSVFTAAMILSLSWCAIWLALGKFHASAHPHGERPHLYIDRGGEAREFPHGMPNIVVYAGRDYREDAWGLHFLWGVNDQAAPYELRYRHWKSLLVVRRLKPTYRLRLL